MLHNSLVRQDIILRACTITAFTVAGVWGVAWFYVTRLLVFWILLEEWQFLGKFKATLATTWSVIEGGLQKKKWTWCFYDSIVLAFQGSQSKENEAHVKQKRFACCAQFLKIPKSTIKKGFFIFRAIVEFNLRVWEYGSPSCLESEPGGDCKSLVGTGMGGDVDEGWGGGGGGGDPHPPTKCYTSQKFLTTWNQDSDRSSSAISLKTIARKNRRLCTV